MEKLSEGGNDNRTNPEFSCFPQNETSVAVNPLRSQNIVVGQNDYRLGWGSSGFSASTDGGAHWYTAMTPFPTWPGDDHVDSGGDPAVVFDRDGVVYYAQIRFERENDTNGIFVNRSTNGGFTWSRPCVPFRGSNPADDIAVCGGTGDTRHPNDGTVSFFADNDRLANFSVPFEDKEYIAAGPRPAGVSPTCFRPETKTPVPAGAEGCPASVIGSDRLYVTWTRFAPGGLFGFTAKIFLSVSDDRGRSWSNPRAISGGAPFCAFSLGPDTCDLNQFSVPTVSPHSGHLYVAFENFNTPDENQYLVVRSKDGGATFEGPFFVTPVFDVNYPRAGAAGGRPDCTARGQGGGRAVLTNSCFRVISGGNVVVDKRGGAFADDLYLVLSDNRSGTRASSNTDIFLFKSVNGGSSWIGPTRVNDDRSELTAPRDSTAAGNFGNDQWFPWVDIGESGTLNVAFYDRRLDQDSVAHEWPGPAPAITSRQRPGNYLVWRWGAQCQVRASSATPGQQCVAPGAALIPQPTAPINPGPGPQPGQGAAFVGRFDNFGISDLPSNWDYTFRAGIFAGDYDVVAVGPDDKAVATWTDARNGRSSRTQSGRNPACEQSDVFLDTFDARNAGEPGQQRARDTDSLFLVTPCPTQSVEDGD